MAISGCRPMLESLAACFASAASGASQKPCFVIPSTALRNFDTKASCVGYKVFSVAASNIVVLPYNEQKFCVAGDDGFATSFARPSNVAVGTSTSGSRMPPLAMPY